MLRVKYVKAKFIMIYADKWGQRVVKFVLNPHIGCVESPLSLTISVKLVYM